MAKKKTPEQKRDKSEEIRQVILSGVHKPTEVQAILAARGIEVRRKWSRPSRARCPLGDRRGRSVAGEHRLTAQPATDIKTLAPVLSSRSMTWAGSPTLEKCWWRWRSSKRKAVPAGSVLSERQARCLVWSIATTMKAAASTRQENHAMLDRERERTAEWQGQSTRYRATIVPLYFAAAGLMLAAAVGATIYYLAVGGPH